MIFALMLALDPHETSCAEKIFEDHNKLIYKIALDILHNEHDAEEALSEVMISVIKNIQKFSHATRNEIVSQIVIYSRNAAINVYRKNKRRIKRESFLCYGEYDATFDIPSLSSLEEEYISKEAVEILKKHMKELPDEYRDVLNLVYNFGYSNVEAAKILHITPNAVGLRLFRAKKKLLELIGDELDEFR